jgi:predicted Zn-dependent protease with MMP-like domain
MGAMTTDADPPAGRPAADEAAEAEAAYGAEESATPGAPDAPTDWFEDMVFAALDSLPQEFKDRLGSVAIVVEDEPSPEQLAATGASDLFGVYTGVPRTAWGAENAPFANKITVFRGPHLRNYRDPKSLAAGVTDTVYHEVAHHFGISDARLQELARERRGRQ